MDTSIRGLVTDLLRKGTDTKDWDTMDKVLAGITEEEFLSCGLDTIFNGWIKGFYDGELDYLPRANQYKWLYRIIDLDRIMVLDKRSLREITVEDLAINLSRNTYKNQADFIAYVIQTRYIRGKEELSEGEPYIREIFTNLTTNNKKKLYANFTDYYYILLGVSSYRKDDKDTIKRLKETDGYKNVVDLLSRLFEETIKRPLTSSDLIIYPYLNKKPHFIGWTVTLNDLLEESIANGYLETLRKYKLSSSQMGFYHSLRREDVLRAVNDEDLLNRWDTYVNRIGGTTQLYDDWRTYDLENQEAKRKKQAKGAKKRAEPIGFHFNSPLYKVVRLNFASKARVTNYLKVGDTVQLSYIGGGLFGLIVNQKQTDLQLRETEVHAAINIDKGSNSIFDLVEVTE